MRSDDILAQIPMQRCYDMELTVSNINYLIIFDSTILPQKPLFPVSNVLSKAPLYTVRSSAGIVHISLFLLIYFGSEQMHSDQFLTRYSYHFVVNSLRNLKNDKSLFHPEILTLRTRSLHLYSLVLLFFSIPYIREYSAHIFSRI